MLRAWLVIATLALPALMPARAVGGQGAALAEWGVSIAGGVNPSSKIEYYALHPYAGLYLWESIDRWFDEHGIAARWIIEPWVAFVTDQAGPHQTSSFEIGVSPLFARLTFFGDARLRPFLEGGEGIVYTDLRGQELGTRVQFTSQIGAGLDYELQRGLALTLAVRYRHMSNAGLASTNPGVDTVYGMVGLAFR
jgi:hypothetical protein